MSIKQGIDFHITNFSYYLNVLKVLNIPHVFLVTLIISLITSVPSVSHGHKVNIFAYAEYDKIFTESYFNDGRPCKGSKIQVYDPEGNELLNGKTDEEGTFSFKVPKKTDLRIVLTASMGHKAEYRLPASEIPLKIESSPLPEPTPLPQHQKIKPSPLFSKTAEPISSKTEPILSKTEPSPFNEGKHGEIADQNIIRDNSTQPDVAVDLDQIRSVVEDAVDQSIEKRMKPLMKSIIHSMVKAQTSRVLLRDILGGVGYIFGIMGLIFYFKKREK